MATLVYVSGKVDASLNRMSVTDNETCAAPLLQLRAAARTNGRRSGCATQPLVFKHAEGRNLLPSSIPRRRRKRWRLIRRSAGRQTSWGIALSADGRHWLTTNGPSNDVSVIDTHDACRDQTHPGRQVALGCRARAPRRLDHSGLALAAFPAARSSRDSRKRLALDLASSESRNSAPPSPGNPA